MLSVEMIPSGPTLPLFSRENRSRSAVVWIDGPALSAASTLTTFGPGGTFSAVYFPSTIGAPTAAPFPSADRNEMNPALTGTPSYVTSPVTVPAPDPHPAAKRTAAPTTPHARRMAALRYSLMTSPFDRVPIARQAAVAMPL